MDKKNMYYIVAAVIVVVIIAVLLMRKPAAPEITEPEITEPEVVEEEEKIVLPKPKVETEYKGDELISDAVCADGKIGAIITNTGTESASIPKDIKILLRGMVVIDPDCEKMTLSAGESITCENVAGHFPTGTGQQQIMVRLKGAEAQATVTCE
ncbi:hypothetical protein KY342_02620 [Candidatus Woesearchaeota archaeon]|nr:hypothetical protein [Candidatus Woesearchaeota archaeon]